MVLKTDVWYTTCRYYRQSRRKSKHVCSKIRRAENAMNLKVTTYKKWGNWYDKQCTEKETEFKMTLKGYKNRDDEKSRS
jgi:hypothetical protein